MKWWTQNVDTVVGRQTLPVDAPNYFDEEVCVLVATVAVNIVNQVFVSFIFFLTMLCTRLAISIAACWTINQYRNVKQFWVLLPREVMEGDSWSPKSLQSFVPSQRHHHRRIHTISRFFYRPGVLPAAEPAPPKQCFVVLSIILVLVLVLHWHFRCHFSFGPICILVLVIVLAVFSF